MDMISSTRKRILRYLTKYNTATVTELSRNFGMTKPNIQYHIRKMFNENLVEIIEQTPDYEKSPGRPEITYKLAKKGMPDNMSQLSEILMSKLLTSTASEKKEELSYQIGEKIIGESCKELSLPGCLTSLVSILNAKSYQARWEAHHNGPRVMFHNCPYAAILEQFPGLCKIDEYALESYIRRPVRQTQKVDLESGRVSECVFQVVI